MLDGMKAIRQPHQAHAGLPPTQTARWALNSTVFIDVPGRMPRMFEIMSNTRQALIGFGLDILGKSHQRRDRRSPGAGPTRRISPVRPGVLKLVGHSGALMIPLPTM